MGEIGHPIVLVIDGSGPRAGSWLHPKLLIPFLMWVDKLFALKAFDWVARILAGDLLAARGARGLKQKFGRFERNVFFCATSRRVMSNERNDIDSMSDPFVGLSGYIVAIDRASRDRTTATMGVTDIFEFDRQEGDVIYLKTRAGADPMFCRDKFVRVFDDDARYGYVHAQSVCDVMANGKKEAKPWFRNNETKTLIAEKEALRELHEAAEIAEVKLRLEKAEAERKKTEADLRLHEDAYRRKALVQLAEMHETFDARDGVLKFTDKDRFFLNEKKLNILYGALDKRDDGGRLRKTLEISTVAAELGYRLNNEDACAVGKKMVKTFRNKFPGVDIPKEEKHVNSGIRLVNSYDDVPEVRDLMERAVEEVASERGLRRVQIRRIAV
eukprot:jgi/Mesvir1/14675/Mv05341-RA.1